jgi:hypothetical protein
MSRGGKFIECELGLSFLKLKSATLSVYFGNVAERGLCIVYNVILL